MRGEKAGRLGDRGGHGETAEAVDGELSRVRNMDLLIGNCKRTKLP